MASWTHVVKAVDYGGGSGSYKVRTSVVGTAPTQPPTITQPKPGTHFTETPITVNGACQLKTYVTLYRNGVFAGVAKCDANHMYSLDTDLFVGANKLQTRIFSPTDLPGPFSEAITVYYQPLNPGVTDNDQASPLVLTSQFTYQGYYTGVSTPWDLSINGGTAPYAIAADWGDGQRELASKASTGAFKMTHTYDKPGGYEGGFVVNFAATDARGNKTQLRLLAIINDPPGKDRASTTGSISGDNDGNGPLSTVLKYAWSGYGVSVLMVTSFWLGEQRELQQLTRFGRRHHV